MLPPVHPSGPSGVLRSPSSLTPQPADALPASFPPWDAPPQCSYGWFVDVPPPRGPFFWPLNPEAYLERQKQQQQQTQNAESKVQQDMFSCAPQLTWGWYCAVPPPSAPYFWPSLPEGYVLVRLDEVESATTVTPSPAAVTATTHVLPQRTISSLSTSNPLAGVSTLPQPQSSGPPSAAGGAASVSAVAAAAAAATEAANAMTDVGEAEGRGARAKKSTSRKK